MKLITGLLTLLISLCGLFLTARADAPILFPADQFGKRDLLPRQSNTPASRLMESLGAREDRFEPMSRFRGDDPMRRAGRAVGSLRMHVRLANGSEGVAVCTATLIAPDRLLTNAHCVPGDAGKVLKAEVWFGYLVPEDASSRAFPVDVVPIAHDRALDFAVLRVRGDPTQTFPVARLAPRAALDNESLYLIHHPGGQPQKLTRAFCRSLPGKAVVAGALRHQCDTLPGSSGALIFAQSDHAFVGLHHSGGLVANNPSSFNSGTDATALGEKIGIVPKGRAADGAATPPVASADAAAKVPGTAVPKRMTQGAILAPPAVPFRASPSGCDTVRIKDGGGERCLKPLEAFQDCAECPAMVVIPAGEFQFGDADDGPVIKVTIAKPYALARTVVTVGEYQKCVDAKICQPPDWEGAGPLSRAPRGARPGDYSEMGESLSNRDHPIVGVSWINARSYTQWLFQLTGEVYRLPSESEWERGARGGAQGLTYWWGNSISREFANWSDTGGRDRWVYTSPVQAFPSNSFGLFDMAGNVEQWVADCHHYSFGGDFPSNGEAWNFSCGNQAQTRVLRGGSWSAEPAGLRVHARSSLPEASSRSTVGFRVARSLGP